MQIFPWLSLPERQQLCHELKGRFVGGCVRNTFLDRPVNDFDLATPLLPEVVMGILRKRGLTVLPTGLAHGTVTVLEKGGPYEVTTLRRDVRCDGRWSVIAPTESWEDDAMRRDFTMNALFVDADGQIYDYCQGIADIQRERLRFIGDPYARIREDFLRILRFFRFWATYAKETHAESAQAAVALSPKLLGLSRERITKEWFKMIEVPDPWPVVQFLDEHGVLPFILGPGHCENLEKIRQLEAVLGRLSGIERLALVWKGNNERLCLSRPQKALLTFLEGVSIEPGKAMEALYVYGFEKTKTLLARWAFDQDDVDQKALKVREVWGHLAQDHRVAFPLTGQDLLNRGIKSGPEIGRLLEQVRTWWIEQNRVPNKQACLDRALKEIIPTLH